MAESLDHIVFVGVTTYGAGVGRITVLGTGGRGNHSLILVAESVNLTVYVGVATYGAGMGGVTAISTGGLSNFALILVAESVNLAVYVGVATYGAGVGGVTAIGTGGLSNFALILVAESGDRLRNDHLNFLTVTEIIQATVALGVTILGTSGILVLDLLNLVTDRRKNSRIGNVYQANRATIVGAMALHRTGSILLRNKFLNTNMGSTINGTNGDSITLNSVSNQSIFLVCFVVCKEVATGRNTNADVTVATVDNTEGELNQLTRLVKSGSSGGIEHCRGEITDVDLKTTLRCGRRTHSNSSVSEFRKVCRTAVAMTDVSQFVSIEVQSCTQIKEFSNLVN